MGQLLPFEMTEGTPKAASRKGRARKSVRCRPVTWLLSLGLPICRVGGAGEHKPSVQTPLFVPRNPHVCLQHHRSLH